MRYVRTAITAGALALAAFASGPAMAAGTVKVGVIAALSGPFSEFGKQFKGGIEAYQKLHGTTAGGTTVQVIYKDTGGPNPPTAKRLAQEFIIRDKVAFLAGFVFTPNALAVAPVATEGKTPMVVMNAAGGDLTKKSPYMVRLSFSLPSTVPPMVEWAKKNGVKKVYVITADYAPGHDVEAEALKDFKAQGIEVVGKVRTPITTLDFSPYMQRVRDAKPDALFAFVNGGDVGLAFMRAYRSKGLDKAGIKLIGTGDITSAADMNAMGATAAGVVTSYPYSMDHPSEINHAFVKAYQAARGSSEDRPSIMAVAAFDGMDAIYKAVEKAGPKADGKALVAAMKGLKFESPRGPIEIDPENGDVNQLMYIRRVVKADDGMWVNREFDSVHVKSTP